MKKHVIPKVDDGVKGADYENLQNFYARCQVHEYVRNIKGGKILKFEYGDLLSAFTSGDEDDDKVNSYVQAVSFAEITKKSFSNNINVLVRYINYFIEYFDDDMELMTSYYYLMHTIMISDYELPPDNFIDLIRSTFATNTMVDKIVAMIDYNIDSSMLKKVDKKYDESIQLTAEHLKAIMGISCIHKFIIPIVSQYIKARYNEIVAGGMSEKELYFTAFTRFIDVFDEVYDVNLFNKFYHTATTRISKTKNEKLMWEHREFDGVSPTSFAASLMRELFIDIAFKAVFNQSAIIFIHVCFDLVIRNELSRKDKYEYSTMDMISSDNRSDSMSKWDSFQQNHPGRSDKDRYRAKAIIEDFLNRACLELGIDRTKKKYIDEYEYYRDHTPKLDDNQLNVIFLYFARRLGSYSVTEFISRGDLNRFIMIMKRELVEHNYIYLPFFITGILEPINSKKWIKKRMEKVIAQHPSYEDYLEQYDAAGELLNTDKVFAVIKALVTNNIRIVDYDHQDLEGRVLKGLNDYTAVDEFIRLYVDL